MIRIGTPRWWYRRQSAPVGLLRYLLPVISLIWIWVTARRIARARPADVGVPVICVGNLTLGGAGKTPIARAVTARLVELGRRPAILSRGHGGRLRGPIQVDPTVHQHRDVGDEPLMLAGAQTVWVSRDRPAGARAAAQAGADVVVMDDGHQNPSLKKTLSLVVVDAETRDREWPFGDETVFPSGPLREPLKAGLDRADAIVLLMPADLPEPDPELLDLLASRPVLLARLEPAGPPPPGPCLGFAGLGKPWKMERALRAAGCDLVDFAPLPDHSDLNESLMRFLSDRAEALHAALVCSEKDHARLPAAWRERVKAWPVRARFEDPAGLDALLLSALSGPRP